MKSLLDNGEEDEAYLYLDPKLGERADPAAARSRGPPREVIVFMIGGGCYSEYQNLQVRVGEESYYLASTFRLLRWPEAALCGIHLTARAQRFCY